MRKKHKNFLGIRCTKVVYLEACCCTLQITKIFCNVYREKVQIILQPFNLDGPKSIQKVHMV